MLIETQYFPCIMFWVVAQKAGELRLESCENYQKRSYRNKCKILGANGVLSLSIPLLKGKHSGQAICDVEIEQVSNWKNIHLQSIRSAYGSSPYFEHYWDDIEALILNKDTKLYTFNLNIIRYFADLLGIPVQESSEYLKQVEDDYRGRIKPSTSYDTPEYIQVFSDRFSFQSNLSILDLLFCKGPESLLYVNDLAKAL